ncbi:hypothetical protein P5E48_11555 [Clostridium perfringens]|nr:hypothetical protein [Clostridium perfringens]MDK0793866.1 hypothetical protein [Clostridium perfringens]
MANQYTKVKLHIKNSEDINLNGLISKKVTKTVADIIKPKLPISEVTLESLIKGIEENL